MPVPTLITDLDPIAGNNSPASSESPKDGDDYIRALSAFIAQCYLGDATNATNATNLTGATQSVAHTWSSRQTFSGQLVAVSPGGDTSGAVIIAAEAADAVGSVLQFTNNARTSQYGWIIAYKGQSVGFAVGSTERLRLGSAGQFGLGGANYGTTGQAILSGGPSGAASWGTVPGLGIGQTWQNMAGSRSFGSPFTNNTGKPIKVAVGTNGAAELYVNGVLVSNFNFTSTSLYGTVSAVVPNGSSYQVNCSFTMGFWSELR